MRNHRILHHELLEVPLLVYLTDKFSLSYTLALIDKKCHDSLGDQISYVLLNDLKITLNEILDNDSLHLKSGVSLVGPHFRWDSWEDNWRQIRLIVGAITIEPVKYFELISLILSLDLILHFLDCSLCRTIAADLRLRILT